MIFQTNKLNYGHGVDRCRNTGSVLLVRFTNQNKVITEHQQCSR